MKGILKSMRFGDKDGFKEIYDEKGELILQPNEKILVVEENVVPSFKSTWRYYGGEYLLEPSKGNIYLTNERLVFINIPERMFAIGNNDEARAMNAPMESSFELGDMSPGAAVREYFEIPNIEIMGSEKKEGAVSVGVMVNVFILSSGNQYHLSTVLTSDSDLLMRLMNKKVDNLDQLVNNLKDFFRKTDWMYMEGEKKLYGSAKKESDKEEAKPPEPERSPPIPTRREIKPRPPEMPVAPLKTPRKAPVNREVGAKSKEYFENLYRKGLIKEEIYRKLMTQFQSNDFDMDIPRRKEAPYQEAEEAPSPAQPVEEEPPQPQKEGVPKQEEKKEEEDTDLLDMLSDTLSDLKDEDEAPGPEDPEEAPAPKKPIRAKKVHKIQ